jgi:dTDP-glucose 4,6-dehydratase
MQTLMVTGGAGFIGSNFVRAALRHTGHRVLVIDRLTYAGHRVSLQDLEGQPRFRFEEGDIRDRDRVEGLFRECQPVALVNFAAETHVDRSIDGPRPFIETNIVGVFELLEASRAYLERAGEAARRGFRFLHVSTDEVFGSLGPTGAFSETTPYDPSSPYSASKAAADHLARAWHRTFGLPALITNCSNNYGPYQFPEKLIPLMVLNAIDGRDLPIYGDGGNVRDWLHVEDHCLGILAALERGRPGESYNLGGGNERSNLQIVERICEVLEGLLPAPQNEALKARGLKSYAELKSFVPDRPGHDRRYAIDASKSRRELGWRPLVVFEDGLARTVRWYLENREWCRVVLSRRYDRERLGLAGPAR